MKLTIKEMVLVSLFASLMIIGAYVKLPLPWLPVTFQGLFCAMAGILLGAKLGLLSQIVYITMGLVGLPVFSSGGGIAYLLKPTFGYILGFAFAACIIGFISEKIGNDGVFKNLFSLYTGLAGIYCIGLSYAYFISTLYLGKTSVSLVSAAILPYFVKDMLLFTVVAMMAEKLNKLVKNAVYHQRII